MKVVTAAIIQNHGRFFIARRGPNEKLAGLWEFPGGKVESGETLQECRKLEKKAKKLSDEELTIKA